MTLVAAEPGLWRATMPADEIGLYRVEQGDKRAFAHVGAANPREFIDARSTADKLSPLVEATRGRIARMADAVRQPRPAAHRPGPLRPSPWPAPDWIGIRMTEASVLKGIDRVPLFYGFIGVFGIAGLFGLLALIGLPFATWIREGR